MSRIVYDHGDIMMELASLRNTLATMQQTQAAHTQTLQLITQKEIDMAKKVAEYVTELNAGIEALKQDNTESKAEVAEVLRVLQGLAAQNKAQADMIQELIDTGGTPEEVAKLQAVADSLKQQDSDFDATLAALKAGREANTPPAPTT